MSELKNLADREEIQRFGEAVAEFACGRFDPERFTATRLQHGVYGQRQEGVNMLRIKLPGGKLDPQRLIAIADVVERYSQHDVAHITTRQDIQVHYIPLEHSPAAMARLAEAGLTTREACGNTIRNITACPLAGVCPREHVDVTTHLDGAVAHFLRNPLTQQMPRKFKISFSGCEADCAQALLHDLGVVAVRHDGRFGFKVLAGGGLGHKPHEAIVVESFIEEKDLLLVMEAIISLHNRYSDRIKRAKSRIKFLVDRFGPEGFVEKYREELARVKSALGSRDFPRGAWTPGSPVEAPGPGAPRRRYPQKQLGRYVLPIAIPLGDLNPQALRGLAAALARYGLGDVRTTQDQNLIVLNVPESRFAALRTELAALGLKEPAPGDNVVACPGASTCRLGITSSTLVAPKLSGGVHDLRIRVSGCHNGCAQPETGDIGIYGEGRRLHGKLIPHYQTYFGGSGMGGGKLAVKGPAVPAARIEQALERVQQSHSENRQDGESFFTWAQRQSPQYFQELLADLAQVKAEDAAQLARDHGDARDFKVLQLGGGECAGVSQVQIGADFFEAAHEREYRNALVFQRKYAEAAKSGEAIAQLVGQGLVSLLGGPKVDELPQLAAELKRLLPGKLGSRFVLLADALLRSSEDAAEAALSPLFRELDEWTVEAARFCQQMNPQLDVDEALPRFHTARAAPLQARSASAG